MDVNTETDHAAAGLFARYPFEEGRFDELFSRPELPRPHWARLFAELSATPAADIRERQAAAERYIREGGVTYNVYADPKGVDRPWELDVLPFIVAASEWRDIEAGIAQRAELLNRVLADVYGPQTLLANGAIPPSLIFSQSGFLPAAHGMRVPGDAYLHVYAADLARSPDGRWWVMADRTQAPSGAGYALENRLVVSRTFPALYRDLQVQHLAQFFATLRDSLEQGAPQGNGQHLTVLLTAGPYNETFFEHTLLARYLGFPLVEGGDLTVRDGKVWLKTLDGLKRVHAILRRQDDSFCDPLELRLDSALGVAGLLDCARRGTVLIANAIGAGLLESPALLGFLPTLCERLLDEPLRLPSVATWWCGEGAALADALRQADHVVFKSADPARAVGPIFGQDLDQAALDRLEQRVSAQPEQFVAQELVRLSQAPVLGAEDDGAIGVRGVGLRVFAVRTSTGYQVMPGGLTRVASGRDVRILAMQRGGGSKDTWVLTDRPPERASTLLREAVRPVDLVRSRIGIPSRIAENLYWFGRYHERCDDLARLLREALAQRVEEDDNDVDEFAPVLALAEALELLERDADPDTQLLAAATEEDIAFGLPANLRSLERVAYMLRDRISIDHLRTLNALAQGRALDGKATVQDTLAWLDHTITSLTTLSGFALDGMTRDDGWRFLSIGRRLERLIFQCMAIQSACASGPDANLSWLLRVSDSIITYRARYLARPEWLPVLDLLVLDDSNPRSVLFQAHGLASYAAKLTRQYGAFPIDALNAAVEDLKAAAADPAQVDSAGVLQCLENLRSAALNFSDQVTQRFFNHADANALATLGI